MSQSASASVRLMGLLAATTVCVVIGFVMISCVARRHGRSMDDAVSTLLQDSMPSAGAAASAQRALGALSVDLVRLEAATDSADVAPALDADRASLASAEAAYDALPAAPEEKERGVRRRARGELEATRAQITWLLAAQGDGAERGLPATLVDVRMHAAKASQALAELSDLDARRASESVREIQSVRADTRALVNALQAVVAALAGLATGLSGLLLYRSLRSLEQRSSDLDRFAGRVAHDVVAPLSAASLALGYVRRRYPDDERTQAAVARGLSALHRSRALVDALLDFARAGASASAQAVSEPNGVIAEVVAETREDAESARVTVDVDPAPDGCTVPCTPGVLSSIVGNLVRNAIKHMGDANDRRVRVVSERRGAALRIEVRDSGPGVDEAALAHLFQPFARGATKAPGFGLGLSTVERLVSAHGGHVGYERKADRESVFWLELPCAAREQPREGASLHAAGSAGSRN